MSTTGNSFVLNAENASRLADLLETLPLDIYSDILEYNAEHRQKWNKVSTTVEWMFRCDRCLGKKESWVVLEQMDYGFHFDEDGQTRIHETMYCAPCFEIEEEASDDIGWDGRGTRPSSNRDPYARYLREW